MFYKPPWNIHFSAWMNAREILTASAKPQNDSSVPLHDSHLKANFRKLTKSLQKIYWIPLQKEARMSLHKVALMPLRKIARMSLRGHGPWQSPILILRPIKKNGCFLPEHQISICNLQFRNLGTHVGSPGRIYWGSAYSKVVDRIPWDTRIRSQLSDLVIFVFQGFEASIRTNIYSNQPPLPRLIPGSGGWLLKVELTLYIARCGLSDAYRYWFFGIRTYEQSAPTSTSSSFLNLIEIWCGPLSMSLNVILV